MVSNAVSFRAQSFAVLLVVMDVAESYEIVDGVPAFVLVRSNKGDWHRSEAEPVPVPLCAEADTADGGWSGPFLLLRRFVM